jgi:hypothetical protein
MSVLLNFEDTRNQKILKIEISTAPDYNRDSLVVKTSNTPEISLIGTYLSKDLRGKVLSKTMCFTHLLTLSLSLSLSLSLFWFVTHKIVLEIK